jgi:hypothetical protein
MGQGPCGGVACTFGSSVAVEPRRHTERVYRYVLFAIAAEESIIENSHTDILSITSHIAARCLEMFNLDHPTT